MKRVIGILTITAFFAACGGGDNTEVNTGDSVKRAADSIQQTGDTSALNSVMGDTTSASGIHGAGSGSGVGGGNSGGPQQKGDSAK